MTTVLRFKTTQYRPDAVITVRAEPNWADDITGEYEGDAWTFTLQRFANFQFKFVRDYAVWQDGPNLVARRDGNEYDESTVHFGGSLLPDAESGLVSRTFFAPDLSSRRHRVIVVGSGVGGGILAEQLADNGVEVLVLELGSYLFPSHIANLPRQHLLGQFDKHVWRLWNDPRFQSRPYRNLPGSTYVGAVGYNFGGRSVFWGGFCPTMRAYEFEQNAWPSVVRDELLNTYYDKAKQLMKVGAPRVSAYQNKAKSFMERLLGDSLYDAFDAPMAVERQTSERRTLSSGMFSTADLLFEQRATDVRSEQTALQSKLTVNLNHDVRAIQMDGRDVGSVLAYDRIARVERRYYADTVVLCAGALESPRIVLRSKVPDVSGKVGRGITDHQIWFVHFALGPDSPLFEKDASAKFVVQHQKPTVTQHGWNAIIELGADWNQGRYVDPDVLREHIRLRGEDTMLCELVFLTASNLLEGNYLDPVDSEDGRPVEVFMAKATRADVMLHEMNEVKDTILRKIKAIPIEPTGLNLVEAGVGGVAHEVGSMRMGNTEETGVVDPDLKFWGVNNLYACDLSVFPSSPSANPTLALGALALRLADKLASKK